MEVNMVHNNGKEYESQMASYTWSSLELFKSLRPRGCEGYTLQN